MHALRAMPEAGEQRQSFVSIKQQPQEPYMMFLDRLKNSLEKQVDNAQARALIFQQLAIENVHADHQKVLHALKYPSTEEMINACMNVCTYQHLVMLVAQAFAAISLKQQCRCFGCNQFGHVRAKCPWKGSKSQQLCSRCKKGIHRARDCWSKYDVNDRLLPPAGNSQRSAMGQHAMTANSL